MATPIQQPQMYQQYQPVQMQHKPPVDYIRPLASDFLLAVGIVLGLFLMMIGSIIHGLSGGSLAGDIGNILDSFGSFILVVVLLFGAIVRVDADKLIRVGMMLGAIWVVVGHGFW